MDKKQNARSWFLNNFGSSKNKLYTSKYYTPDQSWPKTKVWWIQIPLKSIDMARYDFVNVLCQVEPGEHSYHYLKVPTKFFNDNLDKFDRINDIVSLYLSADSGSLFVEERGRGRLEFSQFLVSKP